MKDIKGHLYIDTDSVKIAPLNPTPEICRVCAADRQGNRCGGVEFCTVTRNRYYAMRKYLDLQLSMSYVEPATGLHQSRRYSRPTLTY